MGTPLVMSIAMGLVLVNLAGDTRGIQVSFVNNADNTDSDSKGYFYFSYVYGDENIGLATQFLIIILNLMLMTIQVRKFSQRS